MTLSQDETARMLLVHRQWKDATRRAETALSRAKAQIGEALEAEIALVRELAERHGFDPELARWDETAKVLHVPGEPKA